MSDKPKIPQGSVPVTPDSDITPISRQPIDKINAATWENLSYDALSNQYLALQKRMDMARSMGRGDLAKQMENGMKYLLHLIEEKKPKDEVSFR